MPKIPVRERRKPSLTSTTKKRSVQICCVGRACEHERRVRRTHHVFEGRRQQAGSAHLIAEVIYALPRTSYEFASIVPALANRWNSPFD
jgi:hypothetical protein